MKKRVNIDGIVAKQQTIADAKKAQKVRFYELQRELHGCTIKLLMLARPNLTEHAATQIVYYAYKYGVIDNNNVDPLFKDNIEELNTKARALYDIKEKERFDKLKRERSWNELKAKVSASLSHGEANCNDNNPNV